MQIQVLQQDKPVSLSIISTQKGRLALTTDEPTPRERQLLLLLDKDNSELSRQAVSLLLTKLDLNKIAKKGWVEYFVFDNQDSFGLEINNHNIAIDKSNKNIKNFLNSYLKSEGEKLDENNISVKKSLTSQKQPADKLQEKINFTDKHITNNQQTQSIVVSNIDSDTSMKHAVVNDDFDDVMIIQNLLNTD